MLLVIELDCVVNFSDWIKHNYIDKGLKRRDAEKYLGIKQTMLSDYMNLKKFPSPRMLQKLVTLCEGLNLYKWLADFTKKQNEECE